MDNLDLKRSFERMGARVRLVDFQPRWSRDTMDGRVRLDVRDDVFELTRNPDRVAVLKVPDVRPADRHLLLIVDDPEDVPPRRRAVKEKFLCGHDERHWFVAAVPERAMVSNVASAKQALKPIEVRLAEQSAGLKRRERDRRKNRAWIRQGEWFFIPQPDMRVNEWLVLRNEPLVRSDGSKPHVAELCIRSGGETVYVSGDRVLTQTEYRKWRSRHPRSKLRWTTMRRNPGVYVKGKVKHSDHATIRLDVWHRVEMNTETQARSMRHVVFLD